MKILCVLSSIARKKVRWWPEYVARLRDQIYENGGEGIPLVCFTNHVGAVQNLGIAAVPLRYGWPRWWNKIEIFRFPGPCLYLDLDVTIVGDIGPLLEAATQYEFIGLRGYKLPGMASPVMAWRGDASHLLRAFSSSPKMHIKRYIKTPGNEKVGDQGFINDHWLGEMALWQDILPGAVMSYKYDWFCPNVDKSNCRVVVFHGKTKPWNVPEVRAI